MADFCMPSLGADMKTGILVEWHVQPGDRLKRGDIIADVETDKGIMEVEVFEDCIIDEILTQPNTEVPVGTTIAKLHSAIGQESSATSAQMIVQNGQQAAQGTEEVVLETQPGVPSTLESQPIASIPPPSAEPSESQRLKISPLARKLAAELSIDLNQVKGTGYAGAIQAQDIQAVALARTQKQAQISPEVEPAEAVAIASPATVQPQLRTEFQTRMRRAIATAMSRSNRDIPHYYLETQIDMSRPLQWLAKENQMRSLKDRILPIVLLLKATATALTDVPELNGYWLNDNLQVEEAIHIGFAISLRQGGLVTPAIHHADLKNLDELMMTMRDLIERTRGGKLRSSELTDSTVTVTSLGELGVQKVFGVIYPPQVALIGFGKITEQPWADQGMLDIRPILSVTLAGDHRATDGIVGTRFLQRLDFHLQAIAQP